MRRFRLFPFVNLISLSAIFYLVWWKDWGNYSGMYTHIYGWHSLDKLAFLGFLLLSGVTVMALIRVWREKRYSLTLLSVFLFSLYWCGVFRAGKPFVRLEGCYESICQVLTLRDNGVFDLETHTQSEMNTYTGSYLLNSGEIKLYNTLGEGSMENLPEELDKLTEIECIRAEGMNFRYWMSGCFKTIYFYP